MKNNYKLQIICLLCVLTAAFSSCKKNELAEEKGLTGNHKNLAIAGDEKWDLLGYGYDMTGDPLALQNASDAPVIDMKSFERDYFNRINTPTTTEGKQYYYYGATANEYLKDVIKERNFSLSVTAGTKSPTEDGKSYFTGSLTSKNKNQNIYSFSSKYSYARFEETYRVKIIQFNGDVSIDLLKNYLTPEFLSNVNTISADALVERYGTHVLTNISLGGRLVFDFSGSIVNETTTEKKTTSAEGALGFFVKKFGINISSTITNEEMTRNFNESRERSFGLQFYGGTNSGRSISFDSNGYSSESVNISGWEQSVNTKNCALVAIDNAVPIYEFIENPIKKQQVKEAVERYIIARQIKMINEVPAPQNGTFMRNESTGQVYIVMDGKLRYIPNQSVLYGLFEFNESMINHYSNDEISKFPMGSAISPNNGLINNVPSGVVYFREGNLIRRIPTWEIKTRYHFNWNSIQNVSNINGYTVGENMTL
nr:MAC/perforin domain-containing protein [uncultured Pedobacter sp.]